MADSSKTEKATPKKRRDERKKGNVFFSNDAVSVAVLLASFFVLKLTATPMVEQIYRFLQYAMGLVAGAAHTGLQDNLSGLVLEMLKTFLFAAGPLLATTAVVAVAATFFQTKLLVSGEALKPKFSRINPLQGIKRLFSLRSVIEALKGILKITVLLFLIYQFLVGIVDTFTKYLHTDLAVACAHLVDEGFQMPARTCFTSGGTMSGSCACPNRRSKRNTNRWKAIPRSRERSKKCSAGWPNPV